MLKSLTVKNYQSHKHTRLEFAPGLNALVGQSQNGKTALLRALHWVLTNRPVGNAFRSWFAKGNENTEVALVFDDDTYVAAEKGKTGSPDYWVGAHNKGEERYRKVGKAVPQAVVDLANMSELNTQEQLDPAFLVTAGAGEVSRIINGITGVEVADKWLKRLNRHKRQATATVTMRKRDIRDAKEELKAYAGLDKAEEYLLRAEQQGKRLALLQQRAAKIQGLDHKARRANSIICTVVQARGALEGLDEKLQTAIAEVEAAGTKAKAILRADSSARAADGLKTRRATLDKLAVSLALALDEYDGASAKAGLLEVVVQENDKLALLDIKRLEQVGIYTKTLEDAGMCPTCMGKVTGQTIKKIKDVL